MQLYDSLARWNIWSRWELPSSVIREVTAEICHYIGTEEVIALIGPRRAGKSTLLYQIMAHLLEQGIDAKAILHKTHH